MSVARLLAILVTGSRAERATVLHEAILLRLADGSLHQGKSQVLEWLDRSTGSTYRVLGASADTLTVALEVADVPGYLTFTLRGEVDSGRLIAVHVEV